MRPIGQYPSLSQYLGPWIHVVGPSGGEFVGQSNVPQMHVAILTKVKPKSMARVMWQTYKKEKEATYEARKNVG